MNRDLFKRYLSFLLIILLTGYGAYFLVSTYSDSHSSGPDGHTPQPKGPDVPKPPALVVGKSGWWEANNLIYHGIPTRILFFLPKADRRTVNDINAAAWREFERIGRIFNPFDSASEIAQINNASRTQPLPFQLTVSSDIYAIMKMSREIWTESNGNFDPTVWPIKQLWQQAEKNQKMPSEQDLQTALRSMGFGVVHLVDGNRFAIRIESHPVTFDFGGIVKGYAVDQVRQVLLDSGVTAGLIQLGGEIATFGQNQEGEWRIGIQHPVQMDKVWGIIAAPSSLRVSTSGNYRQAIQIGDRSFYHIFSPQTGWPVSERVLGVTTVCLDETISSARLDAVATAITVMGTSAGLRLAEKKGVETVILYQTEGGTIREMATRGLATYYQHKENP